MREACYAKEILRLNVELLRFWRVEVKEKLKFTVNGFPCSVKTLSSLQLARVSLIAIFIFVYVMALLILGYFRRK